MASKSASLALRSDPIGLARANWISAGWEDSADGMALVTSVMRVQQAMLSAADEALRPLGLTFSRFEVLMLLGFSRSGGLPVGKIGERLQVHAASVTNAVDRLEEADLVRRARGERDGRLVIASITPTGRELVDCAAHALNDAVFQTVPLDAGERSDAFALLRTWRHELGDFE